MSFAAESRPGEGGIFAVKKKRFSVEQIVGVLKQAEWCADGIGKKD